MPDFRRVLGATIAVLLTASLAGAQTTTGTISGHVVDTQGLPLPGVFVNVESPNLQGVRTTVTSETGDYVTTLLPAGVYTLTFELAGMEKQQKTVSLAPTQVAPVEVTMGLATLKEEVNVVGRAGDVLTRTAQVTTSFSQDLISLLPTNRSLDSSLLIAPSVHPTGPGGNYSIAGAGSYESLFLVNGVTINENLRGQPMPLFIEDAIQDTTISTAGISAEYGRFSGGVVNIVTKSGGNMFSGSFRDTLYNDAWRTLAPFVGDTTLDRIVPTYEYTAGGALMKDRLWFFTAGRLQNQEQSRQTVTTVLPYTYQDDTQRYEAKLTYSALSGHTIQGAFTKIVEEQKNQAQNVATVMDLNSLFNQKLPQSLFTINYSGIMTPRLAIEARLSMRQATTTGRGATSTDRINGTLLLDRQRGNLRYWSPTFCGVCDPEARDNDDEFFKGSYFLSKNGSLGSHHMVFGYDTFNDKRFANNHQSGSDYRIMGTTSIVQGSTIYPVFAGNTTIRWNPIAIGSRGTDFRMHSFFYNDSWRLNSHLTFNLGTRFDKNHGSDAAGQLVARDSSWSPRVGAIWDPKGDGKWSVTGSVAKYVDAILNSLADVSAAGNPATIDFAYLGPAINADPNGALVTPDVAIQRVFNWFDSNGGTNRTPTAASYPGVSLKIQDSLDSPNVLEYAGGVSRQFGNRAAIRADAMFRDYRDFYSQRVDTSTGWVADPSGKRADLIVIENTNEGVSRRYAGLALSATYRVNSRTDVGGNYTLSRTYGNVDGETVSSGAIPVDNFSYPEYKQLNWYAPSGDLSNDQRHRARLWANYGVAEVPGLTVSVLQELASGVPYGAAALFANGSGIDARPYVSVPSYVTPQGSAAENYYFTDRDAFRTEATYRTDLALNYGYGIQSGPRRIELFVQGQILNVFNQFQLCGCGTDVFANGGNVALNRIDQTVLTAANSPAYQKFNPFTTTPVQGVNWDYGPRFGQALTRTAYTTPRTFRLTFGVRF